MKHGEKLKVGQSLNKGWDGDSSGSDEIFLTLALLPKRFK